MRYLNRALLVVTLVLGALMAEQHMQTAAGFGFNSASFYRYPFAHAESRARTQGQSGTVSHFTSNYLTHAVDWAHSTDIFLKWPIFSASEGTAICYPQGHANTSVTFGVWTAVFSASRNETAIYAHKDSCDYGWPPLLALPRSQGTVLGTVGKLGCTGECTHLHFQVNDGDNQTGVLISKPFEMSDRASFPDSDNIGRDCDLANSNCIHDGPSDNAGVGQLSQAPLSENTLIRSQHMAQGGWAGVGSSYKTLGGPCPLVESPWVHSCPSLVGTITIQNFIRADGRVSGVAVNSAASGAHVILSPIWKALGASFRFDTLADRLGPPSGNGFFAGDRFTQMFSAGSRMDQYVFRVRQDAYIGSTWRATYYFETLGGECYDVSGDLGVDMTDALDVLSHFGEK